jgi:hypothetical protein
LVLLIAPFSNPASNFGAQVFKFAIYLGVPIGLVALVVYTPANLQAIIESVSFPALPVCCICAGVLPHLLLTVPLSRSFASPLVQKSYVRYPPEGPRPPTLEELQEKLKKAKK